MRRNPKTSPDRIKAKERQAQAVELRKAGVSYQAIATALDYRSRQAAYDAVDRALKQLIELPSLELRQLDLERLDKMQRDLWPPGRDTGAIHAILSIMERRAKLLGLDAPDKLWVETGTTEDDGDAELVKTLERLAVLGQSPQIIEGESTVEEE